MDLEVVLRHEYFLCNGLAVMPQYNEVSILEVKSICKAAATFCGKGHQLCWQHLFKNLGKKVFHR